MMLYKLLKYPFFGSYMVKWKNPLPQNGRNEWHSFEVKSKSGATIKGMYSNTKEEPPKATIVLGHPMGKEAKGYFIKRGYTDLLRQSGFNVVIFDINGFGESKHGNFSYFEDIVAVSQKAKELYPELKIGYHGISLGGQFGTIALADKDNRFDFAIIESAATTLNEFWKKFPTAHKALNVLNLLLPKYTEKIKMIDRIEEIKNTKKILFIYSENDDWVPIEMGYRFHKNCNIESELWTVEEAKHAEISRSDYKTKYFEKIIAFYNNEIKSSS